MEGENNQAEIENTNKQESVQRQAPPVSATTETPSVVSVATLPPIKHLFSEAWEVFTGSLLRLFLLAVVSLVVALILGVIAVAALIALGVGTNLFASIKEAGPAALAAIPTNTYIVGGVIVLVLFLVYLVISISIKAASIIVVSEYDGEIGVWSAIKRGFKFIIPLSLLGSIIFILDFGGIFVFLLPALLFSFFFMFAIYEVVLNGQGFYKGLQRSLLIVSKRFGEILVRLLVYALVYILIVFVIPGIINFIAPDAKGIVTLISAFINAFLGWYGLAFSITLYKQARVGFENKEGASLRWVWVVAVLGWIIFAVILVLGFKLLSSKLGEEFKKGLEPKSAVSQRKTIEQKNPKTKELYNQSQDLFDQIKNEKDPQKLRVLVNQNLAILKQITKLEPENPQVWYKLGNAYTWLNIEGSTEAGLAAYEKAEELEPKNSTYVGAVGDMLTRLGKYDQAVLQLEKALRLKENDAYNYYLLGRAYKGLNINGKAKESFENSIKYYKEANAEGDYDQMILTVRKELAGLEK